MCGGRKWNYGPGKTNNNFAAPLLGLRFMRMV
jgi:hypothetical protein